MGDSAPTEPTIKERVNYDSGDRVDDRHTRSGKRQKSVILTLKLYKHCIFAESAPRSYTSERGIGEKSKVYWAVRTLSDGTKIRHKISPDDPLLKRVPITKLRKSVSASSSRKLSAAEEAIAASSSFSAGEQARMSPPRQRARASEAPRSGKASMSSHSRAPPNRPREATTASNSSKVTRGGHAKITPPREEPSGRKRPAAEVAGGRKR